MKLGVTGTRRGMNAAQLDAFREWLGQYAAIDEMHHGSCAGADVQAAQLVHALFPACHIVSHPGPDGDEWRTLSGVDNETRKPCTHFLRNRHIVYECDHLAGFPYEMEEQQRGGTWYTIGYADKLGRPTTVFWKDGSRRR